MFRQLYDSVKREIDQYNKDMSTGSLYKEFGIYSDKECRRHWLIN